MTKTIRFFTLTAAALALGAVSGCASVSSSMPSATSVTGEAWYTEAIGLGYLTWGSKVWYCPAATGAGPSTCSEAKMVPLTKAEMDAEKSKK